MTWEIEFDHGPTVYSPVEASETLADALSLIRDEPDGYGFQLEQVTITRIRDDPWDQWSWWSKRALA